MTRIFLIKRLFGSSILVLSLFLISFQVLHAQQIKGVSIQQTYKFQTGDSSHWKSPEYEDAHWQSFSNQTAPDWEGIAWFRFEIETNSTVRDRPMGMISMFDGAAEFYLDGRLIYKSGTMALNGENETAILGLRKYSIITFNDSLKTSENISRHILSVRASKKFEEDAAWTNRTSYFFWNVYNIPDFMKYLENYKNRQQSATTHYIFLAGVFLSFALLHFLLFFFQRRLPINLYFAVMVLFVGLAQFFDLNRYFPQTSTGLYFNEIWLNLISIIAALAGMRFTHELFNKRLPKVWSIYTLVGACFFIWSCFRPFSPYAIRDYFVLVIVLEMGRIIALSLIKKQYGELSSSRIIITGIIIVILMLIFDSLIELDVFYIPWWDTNLPLAAYSVLILTISVSAALAFTFAKNSSDLEQKTLQLADEVDQKTKTAEKLQLALSEVQELKNRLQAENIYLQDEIKLNHNFSDIIGSSETLKTTLNKVEQVADTDTTVLILGESGTGKELVARAIHNISSRRDRPLIKVNCAALPATLIESELFGHEKGAFTGATQKKIGRFELANLGTIFLDEIGELSLDLQSKLLRVLQEGEFERVGGSETMKVNARIIAATNKVLKDEVTKGEFREDLFYRLNVFPINMPPLRERTKDIEILVKHFVKIYAIKSDKKISAISPNIIKNFSEYHWPGNIRELENVIERAVILSKGNTLELDEWMPVENIKSSETGIQTLEENEKEHIIRALQQTNWRISGKQGAAKLLDLNDKTLHWKIKKLNIKKP